MKPPEKALAMIEFVEWIDSDEYMKQLGAKAPTSITSDDYLLSVFEDCYDKIISYAKFLQKPLELGMFVPVGEDGNVVNYPTHVYSDSPTKKESKMYQAALRRYNKAKENVLFEGWEYVCDGEWSYIKNKKDDYFASTIDCFTIGGFIDDGNDKITENYYKQALK